MSTSPHVTMASLGNFDGLAGKMGRMRITGGTYRGRVINCPEGIAVRPTASKIRQSFFNILAGRLPGARFLDLFAGSGLMGIEALSRGAAKLIFVDEAKRHVAQIEANLKLLNLEAEVICGDIHKVLPVLEKASFDIIFADPPYRSNLAKNALNLVSRCNLLAPQGVLAIEHDEDMKLAGGEGDLINYDRRKYGQTAISFFRLPSV